MKKMSIISLILALVLSVTGCLAESAFELLPEDNTETVRLQAPSYGAMANVEPERVEQSADGGTIVTYSGVDAAGFNRFGIYLGERGFAATGQEKEENRLAYSLSDGQVSFVMIYDMEAKTMQLVYPEGTDYEVSLFPGYTRIAFNEEINIPGLGKFTFHDFVLNGSGQRAGYFLDKNNKTEALNNWLSFTFFNTSSGKIFYGGEYYERKNDLFTATLVYRNADGEYQYENVDIGAFTSGKNLLARRIFDETGKYTKYISFQNKYCKPLDQMEYAATFDLTPNMRASSDGTIIIRLDFTTGEKYVLVARENGVDLNIAAQTGE